ncbi:heavy metal translocating P-type ATPase [Cerasicoccus maritimus]|uniref:heavy metal translocating P-type ATPase n=1 Tax=Cerasicoccus maritimus TaxID=490089 RepID=UPI0028525473|nr:heavy metal translocating P-type ATPase [Cerasicoccus maritimus]
MGSEHKHQHSSKEHEGHDHADHGEHSCCGGHNHDAPPKESKDSCCHEKPKEKSDCCHQEPEPEEHACCGSKPKQEKKSCCHEDPATKEHSSCGGHDHGEHEHSEHSCCHGHTPKKQSGPADPNAIYTCPMHPEIEQKGPGECPICGMALEPKEPTGVVDDSEYRYMSKHFYGSLLFSIPVFLLAMLPMIPGMGDIAFFHSAANGWLQLALTIPVLTWAGGFIFIRGYKSIISWNLNMFSLIAIGVAAAVIFSTVAVIAPHLLPAEFKMDGHAPIYFESAAVIISLVLLGQMLEARARGKTGEALQLLMSQTPDTAILIGEDGTEREVPLEEVTVGQRLRVKPGAKVPVDGKVLDGSGAVDESMITGEPDPIKKAKGDAVTAGTLNQRGSFTMEAEKVGGDTLLSGIVSLVASAQRSRAPIQATADKVAGIFVPAVIAVAVISFICWAAFGPSPQLAYALINAVAVLIIACPCALGLATPISIMVGVGRAAHEGVLVKNAEAIETLEKVTTLVVDKTGTLTEGKPDVTDIVAADGFDESTVLQLAASIEKQSEHPLALAVIRGAENRSIALADVSDFDSETGDGVLGTIDGAEVRIGRLDFVTKDTSTNDQLKAKGDALAQEAKTVIWVSQGGSLAGLIAIADPIKPTTKDAISQLHAQGLKIIMMTGDNEQTAKAVAQAVGIDDFQAGVKPADKHDEVQRLKQAGEKVAMAGDGLNDAPALAAADVGIAMGAGTDVAMESAGVTLVQGDLVGIVKARALSQGVMKNIRQNLFFAFIYNGVGVPVAAGILYPLFGILLSPMIAAAAMSLSSVSVITNALRLKGLRLRG